MIDKNKDDMEWRLGIEKTISEIAKNRAEAILTGKKHDYYGFALGIAVTGVLIALVKLFL